MYAARKLRGGAARQKYLVQRRINARVDRLRPHRWNWDALVKPIDRTVERQAPETVSQSTVRSLRYFWLDGFFSAISENFYLGYVTLFILALGASNGQVGILTSIANMLGALSLFPGAHLIERVGRRKPVVLWSAGGAGRLVLLILALVPFLVGEPVLAIGLIIIFNGLRSFTGNLANPAWTSLVADIVPDAMRGRYFGSRNIAMGVAALLVAPLAGRIISLGNGFAGFPVLGFQLIFMLSFAFGIVSTFAFQRIDEPPPSESISRPHQRGDLRRAVRDHPAFLGLVFSAFVWNLALQLAGPFFNVFLVSELGASTLVVGLVTSVSSLFALFGQRLFGRWLDTRGSLWVQSVSGLLIPALPLAWMFVTAPWQVGLINIFGGILWAGYNLSNFNLLLDLTPDEQRPRAVALYQTAVFLAAVAGPLAGGYLADAISYDFIFGLSAAGRLAGMLLFFAITVRALKNRAGVDASGEPEEA